MTEEPCCCILLPCFFVCRHIGGSSSGRTTDSDSVYRGSNPRPPATMVPSSRGLGRRPLTAATRVRIPLGLPIISVSCDKLVKALFVIAGRRENLNSAALRLNIAFYELTLFLLKYPVYLGHVPVPYRYLLPHLFKTL